MKVITFRRNMLVGLILLITAVFVVILKGGGATNSFELTEVLPNIPNNSVLFSDDFEDGTLNKWNVVLGSWNVVTEGTNHVAHLASGTVFYRRIVSVAGVAGTTLLTAKMKGNSDQTDPCADMAFGFYSNIDASSFYYFMIGGGKPNYIMLGEFYGGAPHRLCYNYSANVQNNVWYDVKVKLEGSRIDAKVWRTDGSEPTNWLISWTSATPYGDHLVLGGIDGDQNEEFWFDDVVATGGNQPPTAVIDRIIPQNNEQGVGYLFEGHGTDQDGSIAGYNWRSDQDGQLSIEQSFTTTSLSVNTHRIYFKVQDDDGAWSDEDSTSYPDVKVYPSETLEKHWSFPPEPYLWMGRENVFTFHALNQRPLYADYFDVLCGLTSTPQTSVPGFENTAWFQPEPWYPGADHYYPWGDTVLQQLAGGNSCKLHFKIKTHWDWIEPWSLWNVIDIIMNFLPGVGAEASKILELKTAIEVWRALGTVSQVNGILDAIDQATGILLRFSCQVQYEGIGNASADTSFLYAVPMDKVYLWVDYIFVGQAAGLITLIPLPFGINYLVQGGMLIANQFVYVAAHDPDTNFTELVIPQFYFPPQLDSIPNEEARAAVYDVFRGVAYAEALKNSFAKYQGALLDGNEEWAAKQLSSVALYSHLTSQTLQFLPSFLETLIVQPTQEQIDSMKNSFATYGLPDLEESILAQYGCTQGAMDSMAAQYVALPNDYYMQAHQLPGLFQHAIGYLDSLSYYFPELPGNAKIADLGTNPETLSVNNPPPVLNCWVEFPKDSSITGYQIISAVLNDTIQASYISPTPGDYDNDGIPDIAMQFSTTMLIPMLQPGQRLLSVSGDIVLPSADTVFYSGSAILTVLFMRGDVNADGVINVSDVVYLINYLFISGPAPVPLEAGDVNCDDHVNVSDVVYLINYLFISGPPPGC